MKHEEALMIVSQIWLAALWLRLEMSPVLFLIMWMFMFAAWLLIRKR